MTTHNDPVETLIQTLQTQAAQHGEHALLDFLQSQQALVGELCRANPRQPDSPTAERDNPFLYTMR